MRTVAFAPEGAPAAKEPLLLRGACAPQPPDGGGGGGGDEPAASKEQCSASSGPAASVVLRAVARVVAGLSGSSAAGDNPKFDTSMGARAFLFCRRTRSARRAALMFYILVGFYERPAYCVWHPNAELLCPGGSPSKELVTWPATMLSLEHGLELVVLPLLALLFDSCLHELCLILEGSWRRAVAAHWYLALVALNFAEVMVRLIAPEVLPWRVAPYRVLRPLLIVCASLRTRQGLGLVAQAAWATRQLYMTLAVFLLVSAWIGVVLFGYNTAHYFEDFPTSLLNLFILLTTSNYPDVQTPMVNESRSAFVFFLVFLMVGLFLLTNLIFSSIYSEYRLLLEEKVLRSLRLREAALQDSFKLLCGANTNKTLAPKFDEGGSDFHRSYSCASDQAVMDKATWCDFYASWAPRAIGERSAETRGPAIFELVQRKSYSAGGLDLREFAALVLALGDKDVAYRVANVRRVRVNTFQRRRLEIAKFLQRPLTQRVLDLLFCVNIALLAAETHEYLRRQGEPLQSLQLGPAFFTVLWALELAARVFSQGGLLRFWLGVGGSAGQHRLELLLVGATTLADVWEWLPFTAKPESFHKQLMVLQIARALRVAGRGERFQDVLRAIVRILPAGIVVANILLAVCLSYAEIGLQLFGGVLYPSNPALRGTAWVQAAYWSNNFNSLGSAMMVLFEQLVVNNWFIVMDALAEARGPWSRWYFITHYLVAVTIIMNAALAFLIEAWHGQKNRLNRTRQELGPVCAELDGQAAGAGATPLSRKPSSAFETPGQVIRRGMSVVDELSPQIDGLTPWPASPDELRRALARPRAVSTLTSCSEKEWLPTEESLLQDMFADEITKLLSAEDLAPQLSVRRFHAARLRPKDYIQQVPGLAHILRHDLGQPIPRTGEGGWLFSRPR